MVWPEPVAWRGQWLAGRRELFSGEAGPAEPPVSSAERVELARPVGGEGLVCQAARSRQSRAVEEAGTLYRHGCADRCTVWTPVAVTTAVLGRDSASRRSSPYPHWVESI